MLQEAAKQKQFRINVDAIERFSLASDNPAFKTKKFREALLDYRRYKLRTPNAHKITLKDELFYIERNIQNLQPQVETDILFI